MLCLLVIAVWYYIFKRFWYTRFSFVIKQGFLNHHLNFYFYFAPLLLFSFCICFHASMGWIGVFLMAFLQASQFCANPGCNLDFLKSSLTSCVYVLPGYLSLSAGQPQWSYCCWLVFLSILSTCPNHLSFFSDAKHLLWYSGCAMSVL